MVCVCVRVLLPQERLRPPPPNPPCTDPISRHQLMREVRLHAQLDHPNIIKLYGAFKQDDAVVMVQVRAPSAGHAPCVQHVAGVQGGGHEGWARGRRHDAGGWVMGAGR